MEGGERDVLRKKESVGGRDAPSQTLYPGLIVRKVVSKNLVVFTYASGFVSADELDLLNLPDRFDPEAQMFVWGKLHISQEQCPSSTDTWE